MSMEEKYHIVKSVGKECIDEEELRNLLANKPEPVCYDGFEPSGRMHIAQGIMKAIIVNKLTSAGCRVKIVMADWFALLNNKMGGDLKKIETVGRYMIEVWKALGMDVGGKVEILWSSKEISSRSDEYFPLVIDIARRNKLPRIIRCSQIMGRSEKDELSAAQIVYPLMQCADIIFLEADICQMGMDQRSVNLLAREYCDDIKRKNKPIILSHHMLPGLQQGQEKMSKSDPSSCIFMDEDEAEVNLKVKKAYCPPKIVEGNPCLEFVKLIILPWFEEIIVERNAENGGNKTFTSFEELIADYESGELHPADLKPALSKALNKILERVREYFKKDSNAKDLSKTVKAYMVPTLSSRGRVCPQNKQAKPGQANLSLAQPVYTLPHELASSSSNPCIHMSMERYHTVKSVGEECIEEEELRNLLVNKSEPICYDGFEPSGRMHIAQGIMKAISVNKLTSAGC